MTIESQIKHYLSEVQMEEKRLFEIGFKDYPSSNTYSYKFYVAAENGEEAIKKARKWVVKDHLHWWDDEGRIMKMVDILGDEIEDWEETTDAEVEKRFAESPPLTAALSSAKEERIAEIETMSLGKVLDVGTLIV